MNWLTRALTSSLGRKWVMGLTGLLLIGFTVIHLAGNLLLYVGFSNYNHYAHSLHSRPALVLFAEIGLMVLFLSHIFIAIQLTGKNRRSRPQHYALTRSKQTRSKASPSAVMFISGAVILGFVLLHLSDFRFEIRHPGSAGEEPADKALRLLQDPISGVVYFVGSLLLGWHLLHGFQSVFQTFGLTHPKYTPWIKKFGVVLAIILGLGFASFPVWAFMKKWGVLA